MLGVLHSSAYVIQSSPAGEHLVVSRSSDNLRFTSVVGGEIRGAALLGVFDSGTQAASIGVEHTLATASLQSGVYQLFLDTGEMQDGDSVRVRIYYTLLSGGIKRLAQEAVYTNGQAGVEIKSSHPMPTDILWECSIEQLTGTGRSYPWKVIG